MKNTNVKEIKNLFEFESKTINIAQGTTLQEAVYNIYPQLQIIENTYNIGGTKLIAEMSADFIGISQSYFNYEQNIEIKNYSELKLTYINNSQNIINQIINKNIFVNISSINSVILGSVFNIFVDITNNTNRTLTIIIDQGQMIEVQAVNVQNLVVYEALTVILQPNEHKNIILKAYCAAEKRSSPSGKQAKLTPFKLNAPQSAFSSQENIWNFINPERKRWNKYIDTATTTITVGNSDNVGIKEKILDYIANYSQITVPLLAQFLNVNNRTIERYIKELRKEGKIVREGSKKTGQWKIVEKN